jgi:hypothetical protein
VEGCAGTGALRRMANRWPAQVVVGTCDASTLLFCWRAVAADWLFRGSVHRSTRRVQWLWGLGSGWLVNAVAIVAASRLRNWRRRNEGGEQRQRSSTSTAAPAAPVAQGPLKIMERQASKASRETRAPGWGWMTWTTSFRKSKPALH